MAELGIGIRRQENGKGLRSEDMGWIEPKDKMPPEGLQVLVELSGRSIDEHGVHLVSDHDFYIGTWIHPVGEEKGHWFIENQREIWALNVHAWMPLPKHFQQKEQAYEPEPDMMEHAMFEDDPDWLYKDDAVYEQMTLDEFLQIGGAREG